VAAITVSCGVLLTVAFAPLIMVAGEPLRRYVLAKPPACQPGALNVKPKDE
jgi:hypothetical protein